MSARSFRRARARELRKKGALAAAGALGSTVLLAPGAEAATFSVTNLNSSGAGSLDEAVDDANTSAGADQITFQAGLTGTITLESDLDVNEAVEVIGPGASVITVDGDDAFQFQLYGFDSANEAVSVSGLTLHNGSSSYGGNFYNGSFNGDPAGQVTLSGVVITGGEATGGSGDGGGVYNFGGDLTITDSTISGNIADDQGGGVWSDDGKLTILRTTITQNTASGDYAGGVYVRDTDGDGGDEVVIQDASFTGNDSYDDGGGAYFESVDGNIVIARSTFANNTSGEDGGGFVANTETGNMRVSETTVTGNTADNTGGGIWFLGVDGPVTVANSTVSGNSALYTGGIQFYSEDSDPLNLTNSTIVGNSATATDYSAGGLHLYGDDSQAGAPTANVSSTIIAGNTSGPGTGPDIDGGDDLDDPAQFNIGFSLIGNTTLTEGATLTATGPNLTGVDPQLGPLADNGGPTQMHAPAATSPVIDAGIANGLATDQRGAPRTFDAANVANAAGGDGTDIGAVELLPGGRLALAQCKGAAENVLFAPGTAIVGTDANDVIVGTPANDSIKSGKGKDLVCAEGGNDSLKAGAGKDRAFGAAGKDKLKGNGGNDKLSGQGGKDTLKGGGGKDTLKGGGGKDKLRGGPGKDKLRGGAGKDSEVQ